MSTEKEYVVHDNTVYLKERKGLYCSFTPCKVPKETPVPKWEGPKIPWNIWSEIVAWCQITQEIHKSEALAYLFFDTDTGTWSHWFCPQITQGMTVQADDNHTDWAAQRKLFPDLQFGSVHHHCTSGAFASSTDKDDEKDREGLHFTVGKVGQKVHDLHYRFSIEGQCYEGDAHTVIDYSPELEFVPDRFKEDLHKSLCHEAQTGFDKEHFEEPLKNISKVTYQGYSAAGGWNRGIGGAYVNGKWTPTGQMADDYLPYTGTVSDLAECTSDFYAGEQALCEDLCELLENYGLLEGADTAGVFFNACDTLAEVYEKVNGIIANGRTKEGDEAKPFDAFEEEVAIIVFGHGPFELRTTGKVVFREKMWANAVLKNLEKEDRLYSVQQEHTKQLLNQM